MRFDSAHILRVLFAGALLAVAWQAQPQTPATASASSLPHAAAGLADLHWRLVGPFRGGWSEMVVGVPDQPDTFYFGASGGGVWRSENAGRTWTPLFDEGPAAPVGAIAIAPSNPRTIYIGTGQPEPRYDVAGGAGVFRSRDGGRSWQAMGLAQTRHIGRIWVDPKDPDTVLVAAVGHFFGPNPERGVFRSTDGGANWSHVLRIDSDTGAVDLASDPADARVIFAAAWQARQYPWQSYFTPVTGPGSGIYRSGDGGLTWQRLAGTGLPAGPLGRISLATTRTPTALRIYATVSATSLHTDPAGSAPQGSGLYRSDDAGASWVRVNAEGSLANYYSSRIVAAPDDPDVVYAVGRSLRRCTQGGKTCEIIKGAPGGDDFHQVWVNPLHPDHIAATSDQGTTVSVDGGRTWSGWYNQPTGQFYALAADDRFPYWIYSGQQDSGTVAIASRSDFGSIGLRDWHPVAGDEREWVLPDPDDPSIVYSSGLGGRVTRFDARTGQAANVTPFPVENYGKRQTSTEHHFAWVTPLAFSRTRPKTLFLGGEVLFASTDEGRHWTTISPDLTGRQADARRCDGTVAVADAMACGYGSIWSIAPSPRHAGEVWIGTDDGLLHVTRDGGAHWTNRTPAGLSAWAKVAAIDVSSREDGVAYAAIDMQRMDDFRPLLLRTRDYGASWQDITGDLPRDRFASVVRADPLRPGLLYAGTETGAWVSLDDGAHWAPMRSGLPTAWVRDLLVHGNDLIAATQGRGLYVLDNLTPLRSLAAGSVPADKPWLVAPAPAWRVRFNNNRDTPFPVEEPAGANPPEGAVLDYFLPQAAKQVEIEIRDAAGNLVQRLGSEPEREPEADLYFSRSWLLPARPLPTDAGMHRVAWNLRHARPLAIQYEYSIAAVPGHPTPVTPEGALALPGTYKVTLRADGASSVQDLELRQDPRVPVAAEDLRRSLALSQSIAAGLARAHQGVGERETVREQAEAAQAALRAKGEGEALSRQIAQFLDRMKALEAATSFQAQSSILAGIETDLESADFAPTEAQRRYAGNAIAAVDSLWTRWALLRGGELVAINKALRAAGLAPVHIPPPDELVVKPPEGGDDLP